MIQQSGVTYRAIQLAWKAGSTPTDKRYWSLLVCIALTTTGALAADYPVRPIRIIVPQSPAGTTDFTARVIASQLSERLGQPVVVDNRAGAGSMVGTDLVAKAPPDGYTLLVAASALTIIPSMYKKVPFDPVRDFSPITTLSWYPNVVVVHPSLPVNSMKELIALAKAKPGTLNYASGGTGTGTQLGALLFASMAGISLVHVPYKGGGPAMTALLGREVQLYFAPMPSALQLMKAGRLKALAVTSSKRSRVALELPTISEAGLKDYDESTWNGVFAPARAPASIVEKLNSELEAILKTPLTRDRLASEGAEPAWIRPEEFAAMIRNEVAKWAKVVSQAGIQPE
jgi:tripartite-type tricarboxylate transporter receptor subunit TctC